MSVFCSGHRDLLCIPKSLSAPQTFHPNYPSTPSFDSVGCSGSQNNSAADPASSHHPEADQPKHLQYQMTHYSSDYFGCGWNHHHQETGQPKPPNPHYSDYSASSHRPAVGSSRIAIFHISILSLRITREARETDPNIAPQTSIPRIRFQGPIRVPNTLTPIWVRHNIQLLLPRRAVWMLQSSLWSGLWCRARGGGVGRSFPLRSTRG
jgi:hypothetical protein